MKVDLDELERKARATNQGEWEVGDPDEPYEVVDVELGKLVVRVGRAPIGPITQHIAAASPPVVLALVARIRELDAALADAIEIMPYCGRRDRLVDVLAKDAVIP